jgi:hypothetical protein
MGSSPSKSPTFTLLLLRSHFSVSVGESSIAVMRPFPTYSFFSTLMRHVKPDTVPVPTTPHPCEDVCTFEATDEAFGTRNIAV